MLHVLLLLPAGPPKAGVVLRTGVRLPRVAQLGPSRRVLAFIVGLARGSFVLRLRVACVVPQHFVGIGSACVRAPVRQLRPLAFLLVLRIAFARRTCNDLQRLGTFWPPVRQVVCAKRLAEATPTATTHS